MVQISLNDIQLPDITHINYVFTQFTKIKTNSAHLKIHSIVDKTFLLERLIFRGALKLLVSGNFPPVASSSKNWPTPVIEIRTRRSWLRRPWTLCGRPGATAPRFGDLGMFFSWKRVASAGSTETEVRYDWTPKKIPSKHRKTSGGMTGMSRGSFWRRL